MLDGDVFRTLGRAAPVDPWTRAVAHAGGLHPGDGQMRLGLGHVDVVVGRGNAHGCADILLAVHREAIGFHPSEAESDREDARFVDAQVRFEQLEHVVEEGMVLVVAPPWH